jgi:hypothetical protein
MRTKKIQENDCCDILIPGCEILDNIIKSLVGAQIQGLFVNNITTPAYVAKIAAAGSATAIGGLIASLIVIGGTVYCCGILKDQSIVLIPSDRLCKFSYLDLVRPRDLLNIYTCKQIQEFLQNCHKYCCQHQQNSPADSNNSALIPREMMRTPENDGEAPMAVITELPMATAVDNNLTQASAPTLQEIETTQVQEKSAKERLAYV